MAQLVQNSWSAGRSDTEGSRARSSPVGVGKSSGKSAVLPGGSVDEPAQSASFCELSNRKIHNLKIEVKWCWFLGEGCPGGGGFVLEAEEMTAEELLQRYAAGEREFNMADLRGVNLQGANLEDIGLGGSNLRGADLEGANLRGARLGDAYISGGNLGGANLEGAALENTALIGADLREAKMRQVCGRALFWGAQMIGANLTDADLCQSKFDGADLRSADLTGTNFEETILDRADLRGCIGANLSSARLIGTILPDGTIGTEERYSWP